jgi:hypothetical protein
MKRVYFPEHIKYLASIYKGRALKEITKMFNKRFRKRVPPEKIKRLAQRYGLRSGIRYNGERHKIYTEKHIAYLRKIIPGSHQKDCLKLFNEKFGFSLSLKAFATLYKKHGIKTGFTGFFPKGHVPLNKGRKGFCAPGSEKGWFQKGDKPVNWRPVKSERFDVNGYVAVKVSNTAMPVQRRWKMKHVVIWEKAHGPVPEGSIVIFLDNNKLNLALDNLFMVTREEHAVMCRMNMYTKNRDATKANIAIAKIKTAIANRKRKSFTDVKKEKMVFIDNNGQRIMIEQIPGKKKYFAVRETKFGLRKLRAKDLKARTSLEAAQKDLYEYAMKRGWQRI